DADGGGGGGGGDENLTFSEIYVESVTGSDANDGSSEHPVASLAEARKRIGNKNGDVTIWLRSSATIGTSDADRSWGVPRIGWGRLSIKGEGVSKGESPLNVVGTTFDARTGLYRLELEEAVPYGALDAGCFCCFDDSDKLHQVRAIQSKY